ncbi:thioredoxin domain-containing protein [Miniphocaeibacter halophilus]|uniref:Thioredoxin domain-containing protein n=1 Tax=Miniphocaeibacter halophilus TaxID=2931922 RepID=A0AC61MU09_9FIRM|nr:thioredoxin domain-containing protein [Miniphocaeibacter halophilus]QQK08878.1 thioredoxin domain-containing protein [Miniphocaeibacter halophilus]
MNNYTNHLIDEVSPYLLQHAHNPVDWYPWSDKAFEKATGENKPIFLSIGYSTCHWCHVMAHESFEDEEVAKVLNKNFVSIKVDREERPDIDSIYMNVAQTLTGSGGWPLTIIMTPEKKPFFAGTYFPKNSKYGRTGLIDLLNTVTDKWLKDRETILNSSNEITSAIKNYEESKINKVVKNNKDSIIDAIEGLESNFDSKYGGFGNAPKFPTPHNLLFLLHCHKLGLSKNALPIVEKTLISMYKGGIFDHIGYGFSRYSTDNKWLVPHFEKMLYDNALLVIVYSQAYQITKKDLYKYIVEKTLEYISREMTSKDGGFYSAQDADSQGEEGKYYTWDYKEIIDVLGKDKGEDFCKFYNVSKRGNFEGKNILNLIHKDELLPNDRIKESINKLYTYRLNRYPLHKDDKILVSWNSMMITAYALAGRVFNNNSYVEIAEKGLSFIKNNLTKEDKSLYISYRDGNVSGNGLLDDYAYLAWANLELYNTSYQTEYLVNCKNILNKMEKDFLDPKGGYFLSPKDSGDLIYRPKEFYDGAVPSANSILVYVFSKYSKLTGDSDVQNSLDKQLKVYSSLFEAQPLAYTFGLQALLLNIYPTKELVSVIESKDIDELKKEFSNIYNPQITNLVITEETRDSINKLAPFTESYLENSSVPFYYLCENYTCLEPVNNIDKIRKEIE